jgi:hypothetical protein
LTVLIASTLDAFVSNAGATTKVTGANGLCRTVETSIVS